MPTITIGLVLGLLVLLAAFVLVIVGQMDPKLGVLFGMLGLARIVP